MQKLAVIGGGAAGCFAAANISAQPGDEITLYEKTGKLLQKVKVSGGGRCNVTHACFDIPQLVDKYPRGKNFLKKSLNQFSPAHTIDWFEKHGVQLKTEADGRMFPVTDDSQTIIDVLLKALQKNNAEVAQHKSIEKIIPLEKGFELQFADSTTAYADKVIIAPGGFPKKEQYYWIEALGHTVETPVPSLFTFNLPEHPVTELMGVAIQDAEVKIAGTKLKEKGPLLITHWGFSGPAVLRTSAWGARILAEKNYDFALFINWLGGEEEKKIQQQFSDFRQFKGKQQIFSHNPFQLPKRFWNYLLQASGIDEKTTWGELSAGSKNKLTEKLLRDPYTVNGKTTFKEEFVTCGGIKLSEINPLTMESRIVPGIYFAGEIMDVDGITGGFNFQHAWSSAWIAAKNV